MGRILAEVISHREKAERMDFQQNDFFDDLWCFLTRRRRRPRLRSRAPRAPRRRGSGRVWSLARERAFFGAAGRNSSRALRKMLPTSGVRSARPPQRLHASASDVYSVYGVRKGWGERRRHLSCSHRNLTNSRKNRGVGFKVGEPTKTGTDYLNS